MILPDPLLYFNKIFHNYLSFLRSQITSPWSVNHLHWLVPLSWHWTDLFCCNGRQKHPHSILFSLIKNFCVESSKSMKSVCIHKEHHYLRPSGHLATCHKEHHYLKPSGHLATCCTLCSWVFIQSSYPSNGPTER